MAFTVRQFDTSQELVDYLNDVVQGIAQPSNITGLNGLTLLINAGSGVQTVTFVDADGSGLSPNEVIGQIEAEHASLVGSCKFRNYRPATPPRYFLTFDVATHIVVNTGTANALLGFPIVGPTTIGANAVVITDIVTIETDEGGNKFTLVHQ